MAKRQSGEREAYWRDQVRRQTSSGLSVRRFCEDAGLSEPSFYAWRRRLAERDRPAPGSEFLPVILTPHMASSGSRITIELRGGRLMHLPETIATERIVALVRGLEADSTQASEVTP